MSATPIARREDAVDPVKEGDVIAGKYEVTRILGKGGMGLVVAAKHKELGELRALKFLLPHVRERPGISARFAEEARTGTRITNEHVARVHDVGTTADGAPFMVMEHLRGQDLAAVIRDGGQLPIARSIDLLLQACEAIAEAHTLGIVHRDLKPGNLFVTKAADGAPFVKVLDFGISKTTGTGDLSVTGSTGVLGSPLYMSPEQLTSAQSVDARSDVWALGVILYEMLAAVPPFGGDTFEEVRAAIFLGTFPKLSDRRKDVPAALEEVVTEALEGSWKLRLSSVEAFCARLAPFGTDAARISYARIRGIVAHASAASSSLSATADGTPAPTVGDRGAGTSVTEPGLARSESPASPRPKRWRWAAGGIGAAAAVVLAVFLRHEAHAPAVGASDAPAPLVSRCAGAAAATCERECAAKEPSSCYELAKVLEDGPNPPKDLARAATLYQSACDGGVVAACNNLGALYGRGDGVPHDDAKAVELYKRACDRDFARACFNLGTMHWEGHGLPKNESVGARLFFRACEGGEPLGCLNASIAYGSGRGVPKDLEQAFSYAQRACAGGAAQGCVRVGKAKISGEGVAKDVRGGLAQLDGMCTSGKAEACESLGSMYVAGAGADVPADPGRARAYMKKACVLGSETGCAGEKLLATGDRGETTPAQENERYAAKCDAGSLLACELLGLDLIDGIGVSVDRARGMELLERACKGKRERSCTRLEQIRQSGGVGGRP